MNIHIVLKTFKSSKEKLKKLVGEAQKYQTDILAEIMNFRKNTKPRSQEKKQEKEIVLENLYNFWEGRGKFISAFESKTFSTRVQTF